MSFIWPAMLLLLLTIPVGVALYLVRERRRRARAASFRVSGAGGATPADAPAVRRGIRRRLPAVLVVAGLTILVASLARPQSVVGVPRIEGTVILAFDVSGSMAATDVTPTRMEAAKAAARAFVERQPSSVRIGVVTFSDSGFSVQVPTSEQADVVAAIDRLGPERGTSLASGIEIALQTIETADAKPRTDYYSNASPAPTPVPTPVPKGTYAPAIIVLVTDGENTTNPDPLTAAAAAADRGVRIDTVGVGTAAGTTLEVEGFRVHTAMDETTLRAISERTDGTFYTADDPAGLAAIYDDVEKRLVIHAEPMEVTSLFAGAGVLLLVIGGLGSLLWAGRFP
jgi:Ca-activated chloride channel family protein